MSDRSYSTSDLSRKSGDIIAEALRHPVTLTQRNKPRLVIMNVEDYERMRTRADSRRVLTLEQLAEVVSAEELEAAIDAYEKGSDTE